MNNDLDIRLPNIFGALSRSFNYFNHELFDDCLPGCVIVLESNETDDYDGCYQPSYSVVTYDNLVIDRLTLNPKVFGNRDTKEILSLLVHEMVHMWQTHQGIVTACHHNREWISKMKQVGLQPRNTDPSGAGNDDSIEQDCYQSIIAGGRFDKVCEYLLETKSHLFACCKFAK